MTRGVYVWPVTQPLLLFWFSALSTQRAHLIGLPASVEHEADLCCTGSEHKSSHHLFRLS
jgi:hypothetical protein